MTKQGTDQRQDSTENFEKFRNRKRDKFKKKKFKNKKAYIEEQEEKKWK